MTATRTASSESLSPQLEMGSAKSQSPLCIPNVYSPSTKMAEVESSLQ